MGLFKTESRGSENVAMVAERRVRSDRNRRSLLTTVERAVQRYLYEVEKASTDKDR